MNDEKRRDLLNQVAEDVLKLIESQEKRIVSQNILEFQNESKQFYYQYMCSWDWNEKDNLYSGSE